jgi:hypothetical protein
MNLHIFQYNAYKSPENITPFLYDSQVEEYDILAVQEPAKRKKIDDIICPGAC